MVNIHSHENLESADNDALPEQEVGSDAVDFALQSTQADLHNASAFAEISGADTFAESQDELRESLQIDEKPVADTEQSESSEKLRGHLDDLVASASELADLNMEHRVGDFRDAIPIWANIRSHKLAGREAEIVTNIKGDFEQVQMLLGENTSGVADLAKLIDSLSAPAGVTKLLGSITLLRGAHRSIFAPRAENIRRAASNLRRELR